MDQSDPKQGAHIPLPQDKYLPTNEWLWEQCIDLAKGDRRVLRYMDKEIHGPHNGRGWRHWPAPKGVAWAVKQYNNLGGGWRSKEASVTLLGGFDVPKRVVIGARTYHNEAGFRLARLLRYTERLERILNQPAIKKASEVVLTFEKAGFREGKLYACAVPSLLSVDDRVLMQEFGS